MGAASNKALETPKRAQFKKYRRCAKFYSKVI